MKINGKEFELHKKHLRFDIVKSESVYYNTVNLRTCYARPSEIKKEIYSDWEKWYYDLWSTELFNRHFAFGVSSFNSHTFILSAIIKYEHVWYKLVITKLHNRAYVLDI